MYTKRAVFFLDILGFGKKVEEAENDLELMTKIRTCLSLIESLPRASSNNNVGFLLSLMRGGGLPESDLKVLTFSDSLVISVSCEQPEAVVTLLSVIQEVQYELLKIGLLSRGGADVGLMAHEDNGIMFGSAFNSAYRLESKLAKMPRVLLGEEYINYIKTNTNFDLEELKSSHLFSETVEDGKYLEMNSFHWVSRLLKNGDVSLLKSLLVAI
ncbi:hypothetical protein [Vibrio hyugaensis]|uniref:hypothetical protein n=1 Tax=Vibrio hyugaensis TaxID=1534743 RepID=UPI0005EF7498|nr:hypothetical protein [Vibrio hyugaensis]